MNSIVDNYTYQIEWSEKDEVFIARCLEFPGLSAHGDSSENALKEIKIVVKESVKWLKEIKKSTPLSVVEESTATKNKNLRKFAGSIKKFGDGLEYQKKIRAEWDN